MFLGRSFESGRNSVIMVNLNDSYTIIYNILFRFIDEQYKIFKLQMTIIAKNFIL